MLPNNMQLTPAQLIQMIKNGANPQQLVMQILENGMSENPIYANLAQLAKDNRTAEIEAFARNVAKERGIDFDKEFCDFKRALGFTKP